MERNRALSIAMLTSVALLEAAGCSNGRLVTNYELKWRHPSVQWVYRTGSQWGTIWGAPASIRNVVKDVQTGPGCVIVTEGGPGGDTTVPKADLTTALSIDDGRRVRECQPTDRRDRSARLMESDVLTKAMHSGPDKGSDDVLFEVGGGLQVLVKLSGRGGLFVGKAGWSHSRFVRLADVDDESGFGMNGSVVRAGPRRIVLGMWNGLVICFDPTLVPELQQE